MYENVFYLHLLLYFWVFTLFVNVFNYFIICFKYCFKFWVDQSTKKRFYTYFKYFGNKNYFKLYKITHFLKWHFCYYPKVRGVIKKKGIRAWFSNLKIQHLLKLECELNMHQGCQLLVWPSLISIRSFERGTLGRSDNTMIDVVRYNKHIFQCALYWKYSGKACWISSKYN